MKLFRSLLATTFAILMLFSLSACGDDVYTVKELSITLPNDFVEMPSISFTACFETVDEDDSEAVLIIREKEETVFKVAGKTDVSVEEYAALVIKANGMGFKPSQKDGIVYYTYEKNDLFYLVTLHRSEDCYWLVQFVTPSKGLGSTDKYFKYAKSITFNEDYEEESTI